jgi:hypothetical protein
VSERITMAVLLQMLEDDREIVELLRECEIITRDDALGGEEVEHALVARTLLRELEVNPPGVEIILRLRDELLATRRQVRELIERMRELTAAPREE